MSDEQHFKEWHGQYHNRLLTGMTAKLRNAAKAEDVTAAAVATAWRKRDQFRGEASLATWIYRIALTGAHDLLRDRRWVSLDNPAFEADQVPEAGHFICELERSQEYRKLRRTLAQLPAIYRQVLVDHFLRGRPVKQIARRYQVPLGTVLSRIARAKRLLRAAWEA